MDRILVVGATGQLGLATVRKLLARGACVRALVRSSGSLQGSGAEIVPGDLTDSASLVRACAGVTTIVATANAAVPSRPGDTFEAVDRIGYRNLIHAAVDSGARRFVYMSVPSSKFTSLSPLFQCKRETENALMNSGLDYVIFRSDVFMDVAFAMMGSGIPLNNAEAATVLRPFEFARNHYLRIKDNIKAKRVAMIPGDGRTRHAFVCIDDVATFLASAAFSGPTGIHAVSGPEALTLLDIVHLYERILVTTLHVKRTPAFVFRMAAAILRHFSPAAANLMVLNYVAAREESLADTQAARTFNVALTSAESFLRAKVVTPKYASAD